MSEYRANEDDMKAYSQIIQQLAVLDLQRNEVIKQLQAWEQAHLVAEDPEQPMQ